MAMLLFLGGILGGLLLAGTVAMLRWTRAEPEVQRQHQGIIGLVGGAWVVIGFVVASWAGSWLLGGAIILVGRLFGIRSGF
jgi:hypothetical protein